MFQGKIFNKKKFLVFVFLIAVLASPYFYKESEFFVVMMIPFLLFTYIPGIFALFVGFGFGGHLFELSAFGAVPKSIYGLAFCILFWLCIFWLCMSFYKSLKRKVGSENIEKIQKDNNRYGNANKPE